MHVLLKLCYLSIPKIVCIRDSRMSPKFGMSLRVNDHVLLMVSSRRIESDETDRDMQLMCSP